MLVRLRRLNASAMRSILKRSPRGMRRERRISTWKKLGDVKAFRPRFPMQPAGGATRGTLNVVPSLLRHTLGAPKVAPGIKGEEVPPPTEGRPVEVLKSRRVLLPVMTHDSTSARPRCTARVTTAGGRRTKCAPQSWVRGGS